MPKNKLYKFPKLNDYQKAKIIKHVSRKIEIEDPGYIGFRSAQTPYKNKKHHTRKPKHKKDLTDSF